jgi:hypothetical protein
MGASLLDRVPAALGAPAPVFATRLGWLAAGASGIRLAPRSFALIGVQWRGSPGASVRLRVHRTDGRVSSWFDAAPRHGGVAEPIWTRDAQRYELWTSRPLADVQVHFVAPERTEAVAEAAIALPRLHAGPGQPPIVPRSAWATPACTPRVPPRFGEVALAFVHHTAGVNGYGPGESAGIVQAICLFHLNVNGWHDIGYNFLVDRYGQIFEGRQGGIDEPVAGAQAGGFNYVSTGASLIGDFMTELPPPNALRALEELLAWKLALHGVPALGRVTVQVSAAGSSFTAFQPGQAVSLRRIAGHRDGDQTDCPGDRLYAELPSLRQRVAELAGPTVQLTLAVTVPAGKTATPATAPVAAGVLRKPGGALPGAPIEIQQRRTTGVVTIARTVTAQDGSWSVAAPLRENATLRALHRPAPAVISRAVGVEVAPAITLTLGSGQGGRVLVNGTVTPAKPEVTIDLYSLKNSTKANLIARTRVRAVGGSFATSIPVPLAGSYFVTANTRADARNAAGHSPRVRLAI